LLLGSYQHRLPLLSGERERTSVELVRFSSNVAEIPLLGMTCAFGIQVFQGRMCSRCSGDTPELLRRFDPMLFRCIGRRRLFRIRFGHGMIGGNSCRIGQARQIN